MTDCNHSKGLGGRVRAVLARFRRRRHGAVAPILALALIPILGAMGFGAEVSSWWLVQRSTQHAADSAVLAAAIDAGNNMTGTNGYPTATPTDCTTAPDHTKSWYCQAISTAASYSYARSATVHVEPAVVTCPNVIITSQCYKVSITKLVPIYLLGVLGFNGSDVVGGVKYQRITATALAAAPGPPVDFCLLTTNGDIGTSGTNSANLRGCDTFANGNSGCNGNGMQAGESFSSGPSTSIAKIDNCTIAGNANGFNDQTYECDPYGATTQTFPYNDGTGGTFSESCPLATNSSANIPSAPSGCTAASANISDATNKDNQGNSTIPTANLITQASVSGTAASGYPNATSMSIGGTTMQVLQVCGTAALGSGAITSGNNGGATTCSSAISYTGTTSNLVIIVYDGGLDMNGCTLQGSEPTSTAGGVTVIFAPITETAGSTCKSTCYPMSSNSANSGGTIDIAAPKAGPFSGVAIMQSANYAADSGCSNVNNGGPVDWCGAGNQPTLTLQGLVYMPQADIEFAGAVSKFQGTGALTCAGWIVKAFEAKGTGSILDNTWGSASITGQCSQAGATLPGVPHSHTFYQALVG